MKKLVKFKKNGEKDEIRSAIEQVSDGVPCSYYEYTHCKGVPDVVVKVCRKRMKLFIMSRELISNRSRNKGGCMGFFSCGSSD